MTGALSACAGMTGFFVMYRELSVIQIKKYTVRGHNLKFSSFE
ncbi:Uncharacterised protein [Legionella pneumophila]|nr:Uncharacterised protein [Legionella pneumophila]